MYLYLFFGNFPSHLQRYKLTTIQSTKQTIQDAISSKIVASGGKYDCGVHHKLITHRWRT